MWRGRRCALPVIAAAQRSSGASVELGVRAVACRLAFFLGYPSRTDRSCAALLRCGRHVAVAPPTVGWREDALLRLVIGSTGANSMTNLGVVLI